LCSRATSARQPLSAAKRAWPVASSVAAAGEGAPRAVFSRRGLRSAGEDTDSRSSTCVSPLSTAREPSVSCSVL
jgi:hypothetical protein